MVGASRVATAVSLSQLELRDTALVAVCASKEEPEELLVALSGGPGISLLRSRQVPLFD